MVRSSNSFVSRYLERVAKTKSVLCVGLDPTPEHVPLNLRTGNPIKDIERYLFEVIGIAVSLVPVVKPQVAYYSALGPDGEEMLQRLVKHAHSQDLLVILDAKRADIGETMEQYGNEVFGRFDADACTFVPYLGSTFNPSWVKWLKQGRMVISMIRTSNPEAAMIQDLELKENGLKIYEHLAQLVATWNAKVAEVTDGAGCVGGVVGATWPEQAPRCRQLAGDDVFFLIPGYGAQGGGADGAVAGLPNSRGELMGVVNSSRGITLTSWWDKDKKQPREGKALELVKAAIEASNADLNAALERKLGVTMAEGGIPQDMKRRTKMKKIDLSRFSPRNYEDKILTLEEMLAWFENEDAFWAYEGEPSPEKPHAELTSGLCSDGFFDCLKVLCYPNIAEILGRQLAKRLIRNGWLTSGQVDWVVSSSYAAITFGHEVAKAFGAIFLMTEKDEKDPKKMVWRRMTIPETARVLQVEELITTSGTFQEVYRAVNEGNSAKPNFWGPVGVLVHRPAKLPAVYQSEFGGRQVVALIEKEIRAYKPEECPYCKAGSPRYRPKSHWGELTGKK